MLIEVSAAPPASARQIDLDSIPGRPPFDMSVPPEPFDPPTGHPWTLPATMTLLAAIAISGWLMLGAEESGVRKDRRDR